MTKHQSTAQFISTGQYISLEMKRYIENMETPGKYGWYAATDAAQGGAA